jgi:hypothetical protein
MSTGIDFQDFSHAGGAVSELLDDYEEGTWSAMISDGTNNMTMSGSYDTGYYTKIGNLNNIQGLFQSTSNGSASGAIRISGLPFAITNTGGPAYAGLAVGYAEGLAIAATKSLAIYAEPGTSYLALQLWDIAAGTSYMTAAEWSDNGHCILNGSYRVA